MLLMLKHLIEIVYLLNQNCRQKKLNHQICEKSPLKQSSIISTANTDSERHFKLLCIKACLWEWVLTNPAESCCWEVPNFTQPLHWQDKQVHSLFFTPQDAKKQQCYTRLILLDWNIKWAISIWPWIKWQRQTF